MKIYTDNSFTIGKTPLVTLQKVVRGGARVLGKIESRNPAFSVKCRIGAAMIWDAEKNNTLAPGQEIIEPTSGNTGIALAFVGAARGYPVTLVMPDTMSIERRKVFKAFGAKLELSDGSKGMKGAIERAEQIYNESPGRYFMPCQFDNPANPAIHEKTTGPEIWKDTQGAVDVVVAGVGTGGTITGITRYLKKKKDIESVAVEPTLSPVISQTIAGEKLTPSGHPIQGIGAGFIPKVLDITLIDRVEKVTGDEAVECARCLATEEGVLVGISSGAAVAAARRLARLPGYDEKTIVVILPDSGERYLSTVLYQFNENA